MVTFEVFLVATSAVALVAVCATYLFFRSVRLRPGNARLDDSRTEIASRLISVLATAGFVVDDSLAVLRATNSAIALGLVSGRVIRSNEIRRLVRQAKDSDSTQEVEFELTINAEGDIRYLKARAVAIGEGFVLVLVEDSTEERDFETIRRDFIANVTHEIKTPIGAITLLSEAMEGALDDPAQMHKFADSLRREARRLSNLVTEIIQLSRVESSDVLASAHPVNIGAIIREAIERTVVIAEAKNISINAKYPDDILVMGDGELLTVAVKNLLENAIQYSDSNQQVGVGVTTRNGHVDIIVTDQGVGIPADEQPRVFERFYRVDESRDRTTGGTGLGLSLVKHICMSHRGEVTLFSQQGVGSTFTIRLPRLVSTPEENTHE
jgi:two-component system sensor histidine kinase SenX3